MSGTQTGGAVEIAVAQREIRRGYAGGFVGQLVSGLLWLASGALATWSTPRSAIVALVLGGMAIFPMTVLGLRLLGRRPPGPENPLSGLGFQVAMVLPLSLPLVGAAAMARLDWFFPAFMVALGAHYLPFVFLYGMRLFGVLAALLVAGGILLGTVVAAPFPTGAWATGLLLLLFALLGLRVARREEEGYGNG